MQYEHTIQRYRSVYSQLLRLHSKPYYAQFGEGMEQTFSDLLRERARAKHALLTCALWMFVETTAGIIKENTTFMIANNKRIISILAAATALLAVPAIAMRYTAEVNWTPSDFVFAGVLLYGTGFLFELVMRRGPHAAYRYAAVLCLAGVFLLTWINGAVGIVGGEDNPWNMLYAVVILVGIVGALASFFKSRGMTRTMFAMAITQVLVFVIAITYGRPHIPSMQAIDIIRTLALNVFFAGVFAASALLFRQSATASALESNA